jgi:hypothetical protein
MSSCFGTLSHQYVSTDIDRAPGVSQRLYLANERHTRLLDPSRKGFGIIERKEHCTRRMLKRDV